LSIQRAPGALSEKERIEIRKEKRAEIDKYIPHTFVAGSMGGGGESRKGNRRQSDKGNTLNLSIPRVRKGRKEGKGEKEREKEGITAFPNPSIHSLQTVGGE